MERTQGDSKAPQARGYAKPLKVVVICAAGAAAIWMGLSIWDGKKNPCERLREQTCSVDSHSLGCQTATSIRDQSVRESDQARRQLLRDQCAANLESLAASRGATPR